MFSMRAMVVDDVMLDHGMAPQTTPVPVVVIATIQLLLEQQAQIVCFMRAGRINVKCYRRRIRHHVISGSFIVILKSTSTRRNIALKLTARADAGAGSVSMLPRHRPRNSCA